MNLPSTPAAFLLQYSIWDMVSRAKPLQLAVFGLLLIFSIVSWAIVFSKWLSFGKARAGNRRFLRAFRKASGLQGVTAASEKFRPCPLVTVFDFGYDEVTHQIKARGSVTNQVALERSLQLGVSEELAKLERNMNWLATTATVSPFIGLFGTVWGIIDAFQGLGLAAAIPAAIFYNYYGHVIREIGARMEDFCLEFLNLSERNFEG